MVLSNGNNEILAMPYYNITQSRTNPRQSSNWNETGTLAFSDTQFWTQARVNIEPMSSSNIQPYITAYSTKLLQVTNNKVTAEAGRYYGEHGLSDFTGQVNS